MLATTVVVDVVIVAITLSRASSKELEKWREIA